jgi:hypothetical protein
MFKVVYKVTDVIIFRLLGVDYWPLFFMRWTISKGISTAKVERNEDQWKYDKLYDPDPTEK